MKISALFPKVAVGTGTLLLTANLASSQLLFLDDFDGVVSSTVTNSGTANGYKYVL